jgi:flagellar basal-body rod protein FlgG
MNHSMVNSSVTLHALQQKLDILSNNIANVGTNGYKKKQASFEDVLTNLKTQPESFRQSGRMTPLGLNLGWGVRLAKPQIDMTQGPVQPTDNPLDLAIQGDGLFEIGLVSTDANGNQTVKPAWTKNGAFGISYDKNGNEVLATKEGQFVHNTNGEPIIIPPNSRILINQDGILAYDTKDPYAAPQDLGKLKLVRVVRPQLLQEVGNNLYTLPDNINATSVLQDVTAIPANDADKVKVMQGYLEQSNVDLSQEMAELVMVQRAFQLSSRALTSSDTMMGLANNLRA